MNGTWRTARGSVHAHLWGTVPAGDGRTEPFGQIRVGD